MLADTPLDGSLADRRLGTSFFSVPHRVAITTSVGLPFRSRFSLTYQGGSQGPTTYVVGPGTGNTGIPNNGDVNADGINSGGSEFGVAGQDVIYVPRDVRPGGDISLVTQDATEAFVPAAASEYAKLDQFITSEQCLNRQRGRLMARNSCGNSWYGQLDARLAVNLPAGRGQSVQLTVDVIDLPAFLHLPAIDPIWSPTYQSSSSGQSSVPVLALEGYDTVRQRGNYLLVLPEQGSQPKAWNMQIGVRYTF
jgi:hypothetical protein